LTYFDSAGMPLDDHSAPVVYVMLIEWNGHYAHRIGIGWILLTKWAKGGHQWKAIALE